MAPILEYRREMYKRYSRKNGLYEIIGDDGQKKTVPFEYYIACLLYTSGTTTLLLECGISMRELMRRSRFTLSRVDACLITHEHGDLSLIHI